MSEEYAEDYDYTFSDVGSITTAVRTVNNLTSKGVKSEKATSGKINKIST